MLKIASSTSAAVAIDDEESSMVAAKIIMINLKYLRTQGSHLTNTEKRKVACHGKTEDDAKKVQPVHRDSPFKSQFGQTPDHFIRE
jgi:hypothetical protein